MYYLSIASLIVGSCDYIKSKNNDTMHDHNGYVHKKFERNQISRNFLMLLNNVLNVCVCGQTCYIHMSMY